MGESSQGLRGIRAAWEVEGRGHEIKKRKEICVKLDLVFSRFLAII